MTEYNDEHPIIKKSIRELISNLRNAIEESNGKDVILDFTVAVSILEIIRRE